MSVKPAVLTIALLLALAPGVATASHTIAESPATAATVGGTFQQTQPANATVVVNNQSTDGTTVTVDSATSPNAPFYVAIWTVNESTGGPDTLLGFQQVTGTETANVSVGITEANLTESQTLIAAVHPDQDGSAETVDPDTETILASDTAAVTVEAPPETPEPPQEPETPEQPEPPQEPEETAQPETPEQPEPPQETGEPEPSGAAVTIEDQLSDGTSVTVEQARSEEAPFYVAVSTGNTTTLEPRVLGVVQVDGTETTNLTVTFDQNLTETGPVVATVHPDQDGDPATVDPAVRTVLAFDAATVTVGEGTGSVVAIEDQESDGTSAVVSAATNPEAPFYVSISTVDLETGDATLLGVEQVNATRATNLTVPFDEATLGESQRVIAGVHPDGDGDPETLDPEVLNVRALDTAEVTLAEPPVPPAEAPNVTMENQASDGRTVVVDRVAVPEGGFVAIHEPGPYFGGDRVGSVIGVSGALSPGVHENVTVTLFDVPGADFDQTSLASSGSLLAIPHTDSNANQEFEYVSTGGSEDAPYTDDEGDDVFDFAVVTLDGEASAATDAGE